jgi:hypothetical protein
MTSEGTVGHHLSSYSFITVQSELPCYLTKNNDYIITKGETTIPVMFCS